MQRTHWLLWSYWYEENEGKWLNALMGYGTKNGVDNRTAAFYLPIDIWSFERDTMELDHFHWLDNTGFLSVRDFMTIGGNVWPDK